MAGIAVYSATKHAVKGLSEALSVEFKAYGVRVADVLPGLIDTPILPPGAAANAANIVLELGGLKMKADKRGRS